MGLFSGQFANVVEWEEYRDDIIFWKWSNREIKKGSKLIIRAGQDALFMYNGKVEGVFTDEGSFDIESEIIPFLSTLKGFKFGFNSGIRAEVLFINTKEFTVKWGTKNPVAIPMQGLPGGMPIRAFGTFSFKVSDYNCLIDKVAGVKKQYEVEDVRGRVSSVLDSFLMQWIVKEGRDMFNLQVNAREIGNGIKTDLDMEMSKIGIAITDFSISTFSYTDDVQRMQNKAASQAMIGEMNKYSQLAMADSIGKGNSGAGVGMDMAGMQMGMMMGQQMANTMMQNMQQASPQMQQTSQPQQTAASGPKFCPECGTPTNGAKFCPECGHKLV